MSSARGIHLGQIANESFDDEKSLISWMGKINVDDYMSVALWGAFIMKILWGKVGWYVNRRKLYPPGNLSGFVFMLYYFYS